MGLKSQYQMRQKIKAKRKKRRDRMAKKGEDLKEVYYGKFFIKLGAK